MQLALASEQRRVETARHPLRHRINPKQPVRGDRLRLTFEPQRLEWLDLNRVPDQLERPLPHDYLPRRRRLFKSRGNIHGIADRQVLTPRH